MKSLLPLISLIFFCGQAKSQTFDYSFNSDIAPSSYNTKLTLVITGIKINTVNYDDGTNTNNTSFNYSLIFSYKVVTTGTNIPTSNFYTFQTTFTSNKTDGIGKPIPSVSTSQTIPIPSSTGTFTTYTATYNGSASLLGYVSGQTYSDAASLNRFGYSTASQYIGGEGLTNQTAIANSTSILPITLKQFNATLTGSNVLVNWITSTETNSSFFTIERSASTTNFVVLQKVAAQGNSNTDVNYSVTDFSPLVGTSYYRLKEIDIDGNVTYSSIVSVNNSTVANDKINFYPNVNSTNIVNFSGNITNKTLDVFSISGAKVFSSTLSGTQLALPNLSKGMYIFKITSVDNLIQTSKYIQQ